MNQIIIAWWARNTTEKAKQDRSQEDLDSDTRREIFIEKLEDLYTQLSETNRKYNPPAPAPLKAQNSVPSPKALPLRPTATPQRRVADSKTPQTITRTDAQAKKKQQQLIATAEMEDELKNLFFLLMDIDDRLVRALLAPVANQYWFLSRARASNVALHSLERYVDQYMQVQTIKGNWIHNAVLINMRKKKTFLTEGFSDKRKYQEKHFWPTVNTLVNIAQSQLPEPDKAVFYGDEASTKYEGPVPTLEHLSSTKQSTLEWKTHTTLVLLREMDLIAGVKCAGGNPIYEFVDRLTLSLPDSVRHHRLSISQPALARAALRLNQTYDGSNENPGRKFRSLVEDRLDAMRKYTTSNSVDMAVFYGPIEYLTSVLVEPRRDSEQRNAGAPNPYSDVNLYFTAVSQFGVLY